MPSAYELATYPSRKLRRRRLSQPGAPAPFIVGMTRSGTTLLRLMLDSHPALAIPPETHFVPQVLKLFRKDDPGPGKVASQIASTRRFGDFGFERLEVRKALDWVAPLDDAGLALRAFYDLYARREGKKRWGEKTPGYGERMKRIEGALPEARFIHMIRDGRDVALSYQRKEADPAGVKKIAVRWRRRVNATRRQGEQVAHYMEVRYEDLVRDPEAELRRVCEFIDLDFRPEMLAYHERADERLAEIANPLEAEEGKAAMDSEQRLAAHERLREPPKADRVAVYKREMSSKDRADFALKAGELLAELGYEIDPEVDLAEGPADDTGATAPAATDAGRRHASRPLRIGIVTKWFNRGQPVVSRQTRSAFDELGHETFILARPKKERGPQKGALSREGVWDQPGITEAASYEISLDEYVDWIKANGIDVVHTDQNYQFDELKALRERGVLTVGRFVWEHFSDEHVEGALSAFDVIYSFTRCEQERYAAMGIESPYVPWGIHPELLEAARAAGPVATRGESGLVRLIFPGGFIGHRKPLGPILEAFGKTTNPKLRLLVKAQVERKTLEEARAAADADPRLELLLEDQSMEEHYATFAEHDVCLVPARWEGLGLPHYEAMAFGMPVITNDDPPMNEIIEDERNGLLVGSHQIGEAKSGIPAMDPDVDALAAAIERITDDELRAQLSAGAREVCEERAWSHTVTGLGELVEIALSARQGANR